MELDSSQLAPGKPIVHCSWYSYQSAPSKKQVIMMDAAACAVLAGLMQAEILTNEFSTGTDTGMENGLVVSAGMPIKKPRWTGGS